MLSYIYSTEGPIGVKSPIAGALLLSNLIKSTAGILSCGLDRSQTMEATSPIQTNAQILGK